MPSSNTITSFYTFAPKTIIESAKVNYNFSNFRGHLIPIDPTATSSPNMTYDLGGNTHSWRGIYSQYGIMYENTAGSIPANPTAGSMAVYFKSDGHLYIKNSAGSEVDMNPSGGSSSYIPSTCTVNLTGPQTFNTGVNAVVRWDTVENETDAGSFDPVTNFDFTCQTAKGGKYLVQCQLRLSAVTGNCDYTLAVRINGSVVRVTDPKLNGTTVAPTLSLSAVLTLAAGDIVDFTLVQNSISNLGCGGSGENFASFTWLAP